MCFAFWPALLLRMINALAGPRARDLSAGPVRGVLGELGFDSSNVQKL
jgi:cytochrome-b5 reductase